MTLLEIQEQLQLLHDGDDVRMHIDFVPSPPTWGEERTNGARRMWRASLSYGAEVFPDGKHGNDEVYAHTIMGAIVGLTIAATQSVLGSVR